MGRYRSPVGVVQVYLSRGENKENMTNKKSRLATFAGAFIVTAVLIAAAPQAFAQSCGNLCSAGPWAFGATWYWSGGGCADSCAVASSSGVDACKVAQDFDSENLSADFSAGATASAFCAFNCGVRGSCKIKKGDGLPVELRAFGIE